MNNNNNSDSSNNLILFTLTRTNSPTAGEFFASYNGRNVVITNRYGDICHPVKDSTAKAIDYMETMGFTVQRMMGMPL